MPVLHDQDRNARQVISDVIATELNSRPEVIFAYLYGSFVESGAFHDVDVGVYVKGLEPGSETRFALDTGQRLSERLRLPVDVRPLNAAPVSFLFHVLKGHLLVNRDDVLLTDLMERVACLYLDRASFLRHYTREAFA